MARQSLRHAAVVAIPVAVPLTMAGVFAGLRRYVSAPTAYNVGFAVYWLGWCLAVPLWLLGPRNAVRLLTTGRRLPRRQVALLAALDVGAVATQLIPRRGDIYPATAAAMVGTGIVNAVGEELLWRATFMNEEGRHPVALAWSLAGFAAWHLAPQIILPSKMGRGRFVAASAGVGLALTSAARMAGGLRQVVVAHALTDMSVVTAARFRLGMVSASRGLCDHGARRRPRTTTGAG